jgi:hypothetical protein
MLRTGLLYAFGYESLPVFLRQSNPKMARHVTWNGAPHAHERIAGSF